MNANVASSILYNVYMSKFLRFSPSRSRSWRKKNWVWVFADVEGRVGPFMPYAPLGLTIHFNPIQVYVFLEDREEAEQNG